MPATPATLETKKASSATNGRRRAAAKLAPPAWQWEKPFRKPFQPLFAEQPLATAHAEWSRHLAQRELPKCKWLEGKLPPLVWGLPVSVLYNDGQGADGQALVEMLRKFERDKLVETTLLESAAEDWLQNPAHGESPLEAVKTLAWAYALPRLAMRLEAERWWSLLERLVELAEDASSGTEQSESFAAQLYGGELPRILATGFPELTRCRRLGGASKNFLSDSLDALLDGEGLPHARQMNQFRALAACWTRTAALAEAAGTRPWSRAAQEQYGWAVRQMLRLARFDGSQALSAEPTCDGPASPALLAAALALGGNKIDRQLATIALPKQKPATTADEWDAPSSESEWSEMATLRSDWSRKTPQLHVAFDNGQTTLELLLGRHHLLQGRHEFQITINGREVGRLPSSAWELVCWESDDDVDFLELEMDLADGVRIQRCYLLARADDFLFVADSVTTMSDGKIVCRSSLPLTEGTNFQPAEETREGRLATDGKTLARVLPLALPEWRVDPRVGRLFAEEGRLVLEQEAAGSCTMLPLLFDLDRGRRKQEVTWRQLTVAEERKVQPRDVAVGFRAQVGYEQWLFYRSLMPPASRTVLGQHLICEFFCGRFTIAGETEQLIAVE